MSSLPCEPGCRCRKHWNGDHRPGPGNSNVKLTPDQVREIRRLLFLGARVSEIARRYQVSAGAISKIKRRITWKNL